MGFARLPIGLRFTSLADFGWLGLRLLEVTPSMRIAGGFSQLVPVTDRDRCQRGVLRLSKYRTSPLTELLNRLAAGRVMVLIHVCQQANIFCCVLGLEARYGALESAALALLGNHPRQLLTGVTAELHQITDHQPLLWRLQVK